MQSHGQDEITAQRDYQTEHGHTGALEGKCMLPAGMAFARWKLITPKTMSHLKVVWMKLVTEHVNKQQAAWVEPAGNPAQKFLQRHPSCGHDLITSQPGTCIQNTSCFSVLSLFKQHKAMLVPN